MPNLSNRATIPYKLTSFPSPFFQNYFNYDPDADKVRRIRGEIDAVKEVMVQNIGKTASSSLSPPPRLVATLIPSPPPPLCRQGARPRRKDRGAR